MEQWQFLIQKEGSRTWHPLLKPRIEVMSGRYRVVARSHRTNTDVEVKVTHTSLSELPPKQRIHKRRRRTNSEGLTAVIPFTYLQSGIWELQCSGDIISELLGASWQYTVTLVVVPSPVDQKTVSPQNPSQSVEKQYKLSQEEIPTNQVKSKLKNLQSSSSSSKNLIASISVEPVKNQNLNPSSRQAISTPPKTVESSDQVPRDKPTQKIPESLKAASDKQKTASKTVTRKLRDSIKAAPHKVTNTSSVPKTTQKPKSSEQSLTTQNKDVTEKSAQKENLAIIEQTNSPLRVKGDTAEQILHNLIELALPAPETLLPDETGEDITIAPPLPLLLNLDQTNYVAPWGESIHIQGLVQLKQTNQQIKQITHPEVRIELRSPQNSELLQSSCQPNSNQTLPFAIASSIEIPSISSKLILGEVKLYGALTSDGVIELLASQSFTITADITELLAITVANPTGELALYSNSTEELSQVNNPSQTLESGMSLDLELFNLVKTAKPKQSAISVPSKKKSLPPLIELRKSRKRVVTHWLKLPNVPGYQEKIDQYINNGYIETVSGSTITGTSFPYLRKSKPIPSSNEQVESEVSVVEQLTYVDVTDNQNTVESLVQADSSNLAELLVQPQKNDNSFEFEEPVTPRRSEYIAAEISNTSPLIRQWMLSQGYALPEPINVEYEDYEIETNNNQNIPDQQTSTVKTDNQAQKVTTNVSSSINIHSTPSPYFSISSGSGWEISQIATPPTQIAQEIVVDDTDVFTDSISDAQNLPIEQPIDQIKKSSAFSLTINTQKIEELPIPQLYVPQGELISGKFLNVRVRLPQGNSHLAVKLWLEDCQTRHLLDGPHLLTNLTPNKNGELEVITKLNIPFGCIEIRLEAIAINTTTQQESHKLTIQRTVIPPDLPNIQIDAILGM
ncbi:hypothetical protein IQ247_12405 [Plectonema cf. radiosum LEGE 06105]|uniref:Uncharacterized protein n=1 Tax=Plectonema cf. radiosum LEGE 06105 TaxID=945769 RepID=A0A8J7F7H9_9CYAN|nr:hypothetical protein [Plectonema radiosum]MBE9213459.1 hypothetical protein [Plectonema cf. radiosum LEGE 06105]